MRLGAVFYVQQSPLDCTGVSKGAVIGTRSPHRCGTWEDEEHEHHITMQDFLQGRYDVLASTTIIESGLDLPNVNTLIVEDADKQDWRSCTSSEGESRSNRIACLLHV